MHIVSNLVNETEDWFFGNKFWENDFRVVCIGKALNYKIILVRHRLSNTIYLKKQLNPHEHYCTVHT